MTKPTSLAEKVQHRLRVGREKVVNASFGSQSQTKIAGAPLLLELELTESLVAGAAASLRDWRMPTQVKFSLYSLLWQRVMLICCGYEDGADGDLLAHDPGLKLSLNVPGSGKEPASQPTICRFENEIRGLSCYRLAIWLVYAYIASHRNPPTHIRFDFDGSCIPTHGQQQGSSFRVHYDEQMYFPLFIFDQDGVLITALLRPGEHGEPKMTVPVLKRLVAAFRDAWPDVQITVVMDAGFSDPKIYDWCEDQGKTDPRKTIYYLIKLKNTGGGLLTHSHDFARDCKESFGRRFGVARHLKIGKKKVKTKTAVEKEIRQKPDKKERKKELEELSSRVVRRYGEFRYQAGKGGKDKKQWRYQRRILAECIYDDWGPRRTFWVTNLLGETPAHLINDVYSRRGEAELRIKDAKDFRCDKLSCQNFMPNQFRLLMHVLAQRLLFAFRKLLPARAQRMTLATLREQFIRIPGIVRDKARSTELLWSSTFPLKNQMHALCQRLASASIEPRVWNDGFNRLIYLWIHPTRAA